MNKKLSLGVSGIALAALTLLAPAGAQAATSGGTWGKAEPVAGLAASSPSAIISMSCATPGNCGAGGFLTDSHGQQAMVVSENNGTWGNALLVPGTEALNTGGEAQINAVSCASPGNCSAVGDYSTPAPRAFPVHAFVVSEKNGVWGKAQKIPLIATFKHGNQTELDSVSCAAPGDCSVAGSVVTPRGLRAIVDNQLNGKWGKARSVLGINGHRSVGAVAVSCGTAGNCSAGGSFVRVPGAVEAFVVNEQNGVWGTAVPISGMGAVASISCAAAASCGAVGGGLAVSEKNGTWGKAVKIPGLAAISHNGNAFANSISCAVAGSCSAVGFVHGSFGDDGFVVSQVNGVWRKAEIVPGLDTLKHGPLAFANSVSCASAGDCGAGGSYLNGSRTQGFVVSQDNGMWGNAKNVPGLAALNKRGFAQISSVSCASADNCGAGGTYLTGSAKVSQAFVVSETS